MPMSEMHLDRVRCETKGDEKRGVDAFLGQRTV